MGGVVADNHDGQSVPDRTSYTDHGERLTQRLSDKLIDRFALCCGGFCRPLV
jgi:hypothetical protein